MRTGIPTPPPRPSRPVDAKGGVHSTPSLSPAPPLPPVAAASICMAQNQCGGKGRLRPCFAATTPHAPRCGVPFCVGGTRRRLRHSLPVAIVGGMARPPLSAIKTATALCPAVRSLRRFADAALSSSAPSRPPLTLRAVACRAAAHSLARGCRPEHSLPLAPGLPGERGAAAAACGLRLRVQLIGPAVALWLGAPPENQKTHGYNPRLMVSKKKKACK